MRSFLLAVLVAALSTGAAAQTKIYQVRLPDGRVLFTDTPPPGAVIVSEREQPPPPPQPARAPEAKGPSLQERAAAADARMRERAAQRDKAYAEVEAAERALTEAKQRLEGGRDPREGERIGTAKGGSRAGPTYEERLSRLEQAVAAAEQRLAKARETLNAVR
jgi:hypothetical protein